VPFPFVYFIRLSLFFENASKRYVFFKFIKDIKFV
jgi:hypothetical protein